jgi:hypothetical protein
MNLMIIYDILYNVRMCYKIYIFPYIGNVCHLSSLAIEEKWNLVLEGRGPDLGHVLNVISCMNNKMIHHFLCAMISQWSGPTMIVPFHSKKLSYVVLFGILFFFSFFKFYYFLYVCIWFRFTLHSWRVIAMFVLCLCNLMPLCNCFSPCAPCFHHK